VSCARRYSSARATRTRECIGAGRNGIRFDLNSANRGIDFTAFKHPLAKRQSLGVVPGPVRVDVRVQMCVRVRDLRVQTNLRMDEKDDKDDDEDDDDVDNIQCSLSTTRP